LAYALAYFGFAFANKSYQIWFLFAFYGLYYATTEGVAKAFVADMVGAENRGRAYGIYNTAVGVIALPASLIAGLLWDKISPASPFFFGGIISLLATLLLEVDFIASKKINLKNIFLYIFLVIQRQYH